MPLTPESRAVLDRFGKSLGFELLYELDNAVEVTYTLGGLIPIKFEAKEVRATSRRMIERDFAADKIKPPGRGICFAMVHAWIAHIYAQRDIEGRQWYDGKLEQLKATQSNYECRYWRRFYRRHEALADALARNANPDMDAVVGRFNREVIGQAADATARKEFALLREGTTFPEVDAGELYARLLGGKPCHLDLQMKDGGHAVGAYYAPKAKLVYLLDPNVGLLRANEESKVMYFLMAWLSLYDASTMTVYEVAPQPVAAAPTPGNTAARAAALP